MITEVGGSWQLRNPMCGYTAVILPMGENEGGGERDDLYSC